MLSRENPSRRSWNGSERFCRDRNRFLLRQNISDHYVLGHKEIGEKNYRALQVYLDLLIQTFDITEDAGMLPTVLHRNNPCTRSGRMVRRRSGGPTRSGSTSCSRWSSAGTPVHHGEVEGDGHFSQPHGARLHKQEQHPKGQQQEEGRPGQAGR